MSQRISLDGQRGSLIIEAMIAIAVISIYVTSAMALVWSSRALYPIVQDRGSVITSTSSTFDAIHHGILTGPDILTAWNGDDTTLYYASSSKQISTTITDTHSAFGGSSCDLNFERDILAQPDIHRKGISVGTDTVATDIVAHGGVVYMTADSAVQARHDFYIVNAFDPNSPELISSIHTGPGLSALAVVGHYVYVANTSTTNQLQVIDIIDRSHPLVVATFKLPLPNASSTPPHGTAIAYSDDHIYLGTDKWEGGEFSIVDISNPIAPIYVSSLEIGATVEAITVRDGYAYVADSGDRELIAVDVHDPGNITSPAHQFSPAGWQIEEGNRVLYHHNHIWYGRAGGGFNTSTYKELFELNPDLTVGMQTHISGGVYGIVAQEPYIFVASGDSSSGGGNLEVWSADDLHRVTSIPVGSRPVAMSCDGSDFYVATGDSNGFIRFHFNSLSK